MANPQSGACLRRHVDRTKCETVRKKSANHNASVTQNNFQANQIILFNLAISNVTIKQFLTDKNQVFCVSSVSCNAENRFDISLL